MPHCSIIYSLLGASGKWVEQESAATARSVFVSLRSAYFGSARRVPRHLSSGIQLCANALNRSTIRGQIVVIDLRVGTLYICP